MNIRDMEINDYNAVDHLMQQLHRVHVNGRPDLYIDIEHPYSVEEFNSLVTKSEIISILAEENGEIIGICFVSIRNRSGMVEMCTAYMDDLVVKEEYQRRGIAKKLFCEAEKRAKRLGAERMDLMIWAFNDSAYKLYESLGMTPQRYILEKKI